MSRRLTPSDLQNALPDVTATLKLPGLEKAVEVCRDRWGVPHVRAESEHDAFFAQGFVTAQDRLWHMDFDRFRALGRWAEFAGPDALPEDRLMRRLRVERAARMDMEVTSPAARGMLASYSDGVNAFLASTEALPVEYRLLQVEPEPWEPWHCLAVYKVRNMLMGTFEMKLWRLRLALGLGAERAAALFQGYPRGSLVTVPPGDTYDGPPLSCLDELAAAAAACNWLGEVDAGSNAWVISGNRTASGLPLVAGDSHRGLDTPNVYYQVHLACPSFRVSGYALPGVPGAPHFSHTEYVAWGMTHGYADYQDLFIERFRACDGRLQYAWQEDWHAAEIADATLKARGATPETLQVVATRHGPIIAGDPRAGHGLAFSHPGTNSGTPWADTLYDLLRARSADEAEEALRPWTEPVNNFVYADVHGEFGYRYRGRIPIRPMANAWAAVPGWDGEHEWQGAIPFEDMPQTRNPFAGYVVTCNQGVAPADYPYYINTYFGADTRARRVTARLQEIAPGAATVAHMAAVHADRLSRPAQACQRVLELMPPPADPRIAEARDRLLAWDCRMDRDSVAATIYAALRACWLEEVLRTALGPFADEAIGTAGIGRGGPTHALLLYTRAVRAMEANDPAPLPKGQTWPQFMEAGLQRAVADLRRRLGDDMHTWQWGALHRTRPQHPLSRVFPESAELLNPPQVPAGGDGDTPLQGGSWTPDRFVLTSLSVNRYIHDPADWRRSRWIVPLGASGHPGSPHYADQAALWGDVETIPQLWDWNDIEAAAQTRQQLLPAP